MVAAVQGFDVREMEDTPTSMRFAGIGHAAIIGRGKDPLRTRLPLLDYLRRYAVEGVEVDIPEIAQSDGTARTHMKDIDSMKGELVAPEFEDNFSKIHVGEMKWARMKDIDIMWGEPFTWESEVIISKMDAREMKRILKDIVIIDDGTFSREIEDILYKMYVKKYNMYVPEMKSAYLRVNVMSSSKSDYNFYLDSGASRHMVFDRALLTNVRAPPPGTSQFKAAGGSLLSVVAYGDIERDPFRIPNVYLVQGLTVNLISVGQLAYNHNVSISFGAHGCNLTLSGGRKLIGGAIRRNDHQYILRFLEIE